MTAAAGYNSLVSCATGAGVAVTTIQGIKSLKLGDSRDMLDVTDFADGNIRARIVGLRDIKVDLSGDYEPADGGWTRLLAGYNAGDDVMLQLITNGASPSAGFALLCKIASFDINGAVDGKLEVSVSAMTNASAASVL